MTLGLYCLVKKKNTFDIFIRIEMAELLSYAIQECGMPYHLFKSSSLPGKFYSFIYMGPAYFSYVKFMPRYFLF